MNKDELARAIAERIGKRGKVVAVKTVTAVLELFAEVVKETLQDEDFAEDDKIMLPKFCKMGVKLRKARNARNPRTGETVKVPAKYVPYIKLLFKLEEE